MQNCILETQDTIDDDDAALEAMKPVEPLIRSVIAETYVMMWDNYEILFCSSHQKWITVLKVFNVHNFQITS